MSLTYLDLRPGEVVEVVIAGVHRFSRWDRDIDGMGAFFAVDGERLPFMGSVRRRVTRREADIFEAREHELGVCRCRGTGFVAHGGTLRDPSSFEVCGCTPGAEARAFLARAS